MTVAFGTIWIIFGSRFWIFPLVFAGLIPCIRGAVRFFSGRSLPSRGRRALPEKNSAILEREVLSVVRSEKGRVTPAIIALNTEVSLKKAENILEDMVKRSYASMEIRDNGTVEYVFSEFIP